MGQALYVVAIRDADSKLWHLQTVAYDTFEKAKAEADRLCADGSVETVVATLTVLADGVPK